MHSFHRLKLAMNHSFIFNIDRVISFLRLGSKHFLPDFSVDCFHNLSEAGNSFQESQRKEISEFNSLIQVVSCAEILCWPFLKHISYFSFDLCLCSSSELAVSF